MIDTQAVIKHRIENPYDTLAAMGEEFSVAISYIHSILRDNNIPTKSLLRNRKANYCGQCGDYVEDGNKFHQGKCRFKYFRVMVKCSRCTIPFYIHRGRLVEKQNRNQTNKYCSRECYYKGRSENKK